LAVDLKEIKNQEPKQKNQKRNDDPEQMGIVGKKIGQPEIFPHQIARAIEFRMN